eukprot:m.74967 g.74967  ORF g.74967 m.74967 type:complete len:611 (+) comp12425_c0_seq2:445-2277(+)
MSSFRFRTKAIDNTKPMPIYRATEHPDIVVETAAVNRAVPSMPTGMEREEEEELHIKKVIDQQNRQGALAQSNIVIPVPEVIHGTKLYQELYKPAYQLPAQYERQQLLRFSKEEPPGYDMDTDDESWLEQHNKSCPRKPLPVEGFERLISRIEEEYPISLDRLKKLVKNNVEHLDAVYKYFSKRTKELQTDTLTPRLKPELPDGASQNDPYVAFRKRVEKMQTRKNRQSQEVQYMNMLKLKRDLMAAQKLFAAVVERESVKKQVLASEVELFQAQVAAEDWKGKQTKDLMPWLRPPSPPRAQPATAKTQKKKGSLKLVLPIASGVGAAATAATASAARDASGATTARKRAKHTKKPAFEEEIYYEYEDTSAVSEPEWGHDNPFRFRRRAGVYYHEALETPTSNRSWKSRFHHYSGRGSGRGARRQLLRGFCRRRLGRGGRMIIDRCHARYDSLDELTVMDESQAVLMMDQQVVMQHLFCSPHKKLDTANPLAPFPSAGTDFGAGGEDVAAGPMIRVDGATNDVGSWVAVNTFESTEHSPKLSPSAASSAAVDGESNPSNAVSVKRNDATHTTTTNSGMDIGSDEPASDPAAQSDKVVVDVKQESESIGEV